MIVDCELADCVMARSMEVYQAAFGSPLGDSISFCRYAISGGFPLGKVSIYVSRSTGGHSPCATGFWQPLWA